MTKPLTLEEQTQRNWFKAKHKLAILFAQEEYGACLELKNGKLKQPFKNLETVKSDCNILKECLYKYGIFRRDVTTITNATSQDEFTREFKNI